MIKSTKTLYICVIFHVTHLCGLGYLSYTLKLQNHKMYFPGSGENQSIRIATIKDIPPVAFKISELHCHYKHALGFAQIVCFVYCQWNSIQL